MQEMVAYKAVPEGGLVDTGFIREYGKKVAGIGKVGFSGYAVQVMQDGRVQGILIFLPGDLDLSHIY